MDIVSFVKLFLVIPAVFAGVIAFRGYAVFRGFVMFIGLMLGFVGGFLLGVSGEDPNPWLALLLGAIVGYAIGVLAWYAYRFGVFLMGALFGATVSLVFRLVAGGEFPEVAHLVLPALLCGVVAMALDKLSIIVSTAATGSAGLVVCIAAWFLTYDDPYAFAEELVTTSVVLAVLWLAITVAGVICQYRYPGPSGKDADARTDRDQPREPGPPPPAGEDRDAEAGDVAAAREEVAVPLGLWAPPAGALMILWSFAWFAEMHRVAPPGSRLIAVVLLVAAILALRRTPRAITVATATLGLFALYVLTFALKVALGWPSYAPVVSDGLCALVLIWFLRKTGRRTYGSAADEGQFVSGLMPRFVALMVLAIEAGKMLGVTLEILADAPYFSGAVLAFGLPALLGATLLAVMARDNRPKRLRLGGIMFLLLLSALSSLAWALSHGGFGPGPLIVAPQLLGCIILGIFAWRYERWRHPVAPLPAPD